MYHPAAALRGAEVERQSFEDVAHAPQVLLDSRARRDSSDLSSARKIEPTPVLASAPGLAPDPAADLTIF
jgi:hypothetical protein